MGETRDDICENLDTILLEYFDTLEQLYQDQALLNQSMKSGYLNLSRARYSMGIKSVGITQCDETKMSALLTVNVTDDNIFKVKYGNDHDLETDINFEKSDESSRSKVRRRNVKTTDVEQERKEEVPLTKDTKYNEHELSVIQRKQVDPLKWFGVLVPQSLRQSQCDFRTGANIAIDIATLKIKLHTLQQKYRSLLKTKELL